MFYNFNAHPPGDKYGIGPILTDVTQSQPEYVMSRDRAQAALNDYSSDLANMLLVCFAEGMDAGLDQFLTWAETIEQGVPENRWAALQACATFARGMVADVGGDPTAVAASITAEQETPSAGVTDAILIFGQPGEPTIELGDEWLVYAAGTIPPNQYVEALTFLFFLGVGIAPTAAARMSQ